MRLMVQSLYIHRANAMKDINNQREIQVDDTECYKLGDKVKETAQGDKYSVIMIILNEYDLSVIRNETGILH